MCVFFYYICYHSIYSELYQTKTGSWY